MRMRIIKVFSWAAVAWVAFGCGMTTVQVPPVQTPPPMNPGPGQPVSLSQDVQPIFTAHCASCHRDGGGAAVFFGIKIRLDSSDDAFSTLVNQTSVQNSSFTLVKPSDSANSLLYLKISSNNPPVGSRMPLLSSPLSDSQIQTIKDWIDQGAADN